MASTLKPPSPPKDGEIRQIPGAGRVVPPPPASPQTAPVMSSRVPPPPPPPAQIKSTPLSSDMGGVAQAESASAGVPMLPRRYSMDRMKSLDNLNEAQSNHADQEPQRNSSIGSSAAASLAAELENDAHKHNPVLKRLSRVIQNRRMSERFVLEESKPQPLEANIAALRGDLNRLKEVLRTQPSLLNHPFPHYRASGALLSADEEKDRMYAPPPLIVKSVRAALAVPSVDNMSRDQRWLIDHGFAGSTLLHYACAADQAEVVDFLVNEMKADKAVLNRPKKPAEFYASSDAVRRILFQVDTSRHPLQKKPSALSAIFQQQPAESPAAAPESNSRGQPNRAKGPLPPPPPPPAPGEASGESGASASNNRQSRRLSRVLGAKRLSISKMSESSEPASAQDDGSVQTGAEARRQSLGLQQRPTSQRISDLLRVIVDIKTKAKEPAAPPARPPLAVRRLSVQGHTLESVTYEIHQGETRQLEHTREEVRAESVASSAEAAPRAQAPARPPSAPSVRRDVSTSSFSSSDSRRLPRSERKPRGQRSLSELSQRDIRKMEEFSKQLCSMRHVANRVLQEFSESKATEDLIARLLGNPKLALPSAGPRSAASTASAPPY
eukprot:gene24827-30001_t